MKAMAANVLLVIMWVIVGHYTPVFLYTPIFFALLFSVTHWVGGYGINDFAVIPFNYILLLVNDYLFRLYAVGNHDEEGKGWFALTFGITLILTTLILVAVYLSKAIDGKSADVNGKHGRLVFGVKTITCIIACAVATGAIFMRVLNAI